METSTVIASIALVISLLNVWWNYYSFKKNHEQSRISENLSSLAEIKLRLGEIPDAFRFHGITTQDLIEHEIKPEELSYLISNFLAGQIYYEMFPNNPTKPFPEDDYRTHLCQSQAVYKAWPLIKKLLDNTPYRAKVELTIKHYRQITSQSSKGPSGRDALTRAPV